MTAPPSYSVPSSICREGAHFLPRPWVPMPYVTTGRSPLPCQAAAGTTTVPVTASGLPCWLLDWYSTFHALYAGSVTLRFSVAGRYQISSPVTPAGGDEGGV